MPMVIASHSGLLDILLPCLLLLAFIGLCSTACRAIACVWISISASRATWTSTSVPTSSTAPTTLSTPTTSATGARCLGLGLGRCFVSENIQSLQNVLVARLFAPVQDILDCRAEGEDLLITHDGEILDPGRVVCLILTEVDIERRTHWSDRHDKHH